MSVLKSKDRREEIVSLVAQAGELSVDALSERFDVSVETVRRDLTRLEDEGRLRKVHGGARSLSERQRLHVEASFEARMEEEREAKEAIAAKLPLLVQPGETIFLDTGSTTLLACPVLREIDGLTVITNSLANAESLSQGGKTRVFLLGGAFTRGNSQTVGPMVIEQIGRFRADHAILTLAGIDPQAGVTDADPDEAEIARNMIRYSRAVTFLTAPSKIGRRAAFHVCRLDEFQTLLGAKQPDPELVRALGAAGVAMP
ncbi:DeoR/GlpR family DNA-binding transcription regulator [Pseudodonghicola sp.]|uniref:DeoR/GlpR family DNA-binding transcription regulator n=1 Tax=Pseudodonghicola sp. TaxID=1969463 RepID=UPI003A96EEEE